ncbi:hypothetical protein KXD40_001383 [Peronospora effusa]|nr:hypothetical protein KXD40_001383 [Peronospora effusa]
MQGDINVSHREIDHCDPDGGRSDGSSFADHPFRRWMDSFLGLSEEMEKLAPCKRNRERLTSETTTCEMVDTFRHLHPDQTKAFTVCIFILKEMHRSYIVTDFICVAFLVLEHSNRSTPNKLRNPDRLYFGRRRKLKCKLRIDLERMIDLPVIVACSESKQNALDLIIAQ